MFMPRKPALGYGGERGRRSPGVATLAVLVCLMVVTGLSAVFFHQLTMRMQDAQRHRWLMQLDWLVASAKERALFQMEADATYSGEVWSVSAEELAAPYSATIAIKCDNHTEKRRLIAIQASLVQDERVLARLSRSFMLP